MLSYFFRQLFNGVGVFFRTIRAFFTRQFNGLGAKLRRLTNFSRHATKVASSSFQGAAAAMKAPTKREDYIETKRLFISKSFLVTLLLALIAIGIFAYFVAWPFLLSRFFTAKFWQEDERVADWSGKVIVYHDEEKKIPCYSGKLEEGVLQGKGKLYDENGLLIYEGNFLDGMKTGKGTCYEAGVKVYEGTFLEDVFEGKGIIYEDGVKVYEGQLSDSVPNGRGTSFTDTGVLYSGEFEDGLYSGEGTLYTQAGDLLYKGGFSEGLYSGEGTVFFSGGEKRYEGQFQDGSMSGEGILYREDGSVHYKGSFDEDAFSGPGKLYLEDNRGYIEAEFVDGEADGVISWYVDGKLWYAGEADGLVPDGYGEIYLRSGKLVYAGQMDRGTVDGQWLLTLSAEELRQAFGDASVEERPSGDGGFYIMNRELGLVARCSYQSEESDSSVFSAWISRQGSGMDWLHNSIFTIWSDSLRDETSMVELIPWTSGEQFHSWAVAMPGQEARLQTEFDEHDMAKIRYYYDGWYCTAGVQNGLPVIVSWTADGQLDTLDTDQLISQQVGQAQQQLDKLLELLDGIAGEEQPGGASPEDLLFTIRSADEAKALVGALLDLYESNETMKLLESSRAMIQELFAAASESLAKGGDSQESVNSLLRELDMLDLRISQCVANREKALLTISKSTDADPAEFDLSKLLVSFDPVELDAQALCQAAADYAASLAGEDGQVDVQTLTVDVKTALINLTVNHQSLAFQRQEQEAAVAATEQAAEDYAKGSVDRETLLRSQLAQNEAAVALYGSMCGFAREADGLNHLTGGALSRELDWMSGGFSAVFQAHIQDAQQAQMDSQPVDEKE